MHQPKFSLVIPTRNRLHTLRYCLRTCLNQIDAPAYEIVISDNSDGSETQEYIQQLMAQDARAAERISYHFRPSVVGMTDNYERAMSYSRGEYVILLGDDDGMLPMALFEIERLISNTGSKVIKWSNGMYTWPDMALADSANYLGFSISIEMSTKNSKEALTNAIENINYSGLPLLYINSAVHKSLVEKMRQNTGRVFSSRSPDVYSSFSLTYHCESFIDLTAPLSLAGLSGASNGVSYAFAGGNAGPRADFNALNSKSGFTPHDHVPDLSIYPTIAFAESFLFAKQDHFQNDGRFDLPRKRILSETVERADLADEAVLKAIYLTCADDSELRAYVDELIAQGRPRIPNPRLKPLMLGADGANLHLEASDFGIETIEDAVQLVSKFVWPGNSPLRFG